MAPEMKGGSKKLNTPADKRVLKQPELPRPISAPPPKPEQQPPKPRAEKLASRKAEPKLKALKQERPPQPKQPDFLKEAKTLAESVLRLEKERTRCLQVIEECGMRIETPSFWRFWQSQSGVSEHTKQEAGKIRQIAAPQNFSERWPVIIAGLLGKTKIEAEEVGIIKEYRHWLLTRAGEKVGGNNPKQRREAGIEKRLADVLAKTSIGALPLLKGLTVVEQPALEDKKSSSPPEKKPQVPGSKPEKAPVVPRAPRAWIEKKGETGYFYIHQNATLEDIQKAIADAKIPN